MQEEICKLIIEKLKESMHMISINYNIREELMAITIDKLIKEEDHESLGDIVGLKELN